MNQIRFAVPLLAAAFLVAQSESDARASTVLSLTNHIGSAWGIDGQNIVGTFGNQGRLYDGKNYTTIAFPGGFSTTPTDVLGNQIVGYYADPAGVYRGFIYDGSTYTSISAPLAVKGTFVQGISGNKIVGSYQDASGMSHGFLYDGATWTTIDHPLGTRGTALADISGDYMIGTYTAPFSRVYGFLLNGASFTTLDEGFRPMGIDGNRIVGYTGDKAVIYDGSTYSYPLNGTGFGVYHSVMTGISGNRIIGYAMEKPPILNGVDRPFLYIIPEPSSPIMAAFGAVGLFLFARRLRHRDAL